MVVGWCVARAAQGLRLLSAGSDRAFRVFSTIQDQQSRELSQKHTAKRAKKLKVRKRTWHGCRHATRAPAASP